VRSLVELTRTLKKIIRKLSNQLQDDFIGRLNEIISHPEPPLSQDLVQRTFLNSFISSFISLKYVYTIIINFKFLNTSSEV
jgi:hypothetical protein